MRRQFDKNDAVAGDDEDKYSNSHRSNVHSVSSLYAVLLIIGGILLFDGIVRINKSGPKALTLEDEKLRPGAFIAERAQKHLEQLTNIGPKVTGSYENEVLAVDFLKREIGFIQQQANKNQEIDMDLQLVSGAYFLNWKPYGFMNVYQNVQNIVVRLSSENNLSNHSLLLNCHFDSVPTSPGGSDDGINCVAMLEVLRVLSKESTRPTHNVIFLFNGAEENPLQAAHGFITKHKWAKEVRAVINLEAAGAGGKEILFQSGPGNDFLIKGYGHNVPHPYGQSMGEEIFQSNLVPSDTDFRVFRDFGKIPGLDFAFSRNGYVYHTKYDGFDNIPAHSYQHVGDNLLALVKVLSSSPDLPNATLESKEVTIFFDYLGLHMFVYSAGTALIINVFTVIISFGILIMKLRKGSKLRFLVQMLGSVMIQLFGWILALLFAVLTALVLDHLRLSMSWYSRPQILFGLYYCPAMFFLSLPPLILTHLQQNKDGLSIGAKSQVHGHAIRLIWTVMLLLTTFTAIRCSYLFLIQVLFNCLAFSLIELLNLEHTRRTWLWIYLISSIIPTVFNIYAADVVLELFIPITGRFGSDKNPDLIIGVLSIITCILITSYFVPLLTLLGRPRSVMLGLLLAYVATLGYVAFTPYAFPYQVSEDGPAPQRYWITHTSRVFYNEKREIIKEDAGYFLLNLDRNSPHMVEDYVPEVKNQVPLEVDCKKYIYCGLPLYSSRMIQIAKKSTWIPAPPPVVHEPTDLHLLSKTKVTSSVTRLTFRARGPDHYSIYFVPKTDAELVSWSFTEKPVPKTHEWHGRSTYFIMYGYGLETKPYEFWLDFETHPNFEGPFVDIVISGKYTHHEKARTAHYSEFLSRFPPWTHTTAWIANYHSFVY